MFGALGSRWQLRLFRRHAARRALRHNGGAGLQAPDHARGVARVTVDDELHSPPWTFGAGQIDAVLKLDASLADAERPHILVRRHQHGAVAVGKPRRLYARMQMETHGVFVARGLHLLAAVRGAEYIFAFEARAVGRER